MMRTKQLLVSAMALPLLFAACSQEELVSDNSNSLTGRKTVQNVVINTDVPATRMEFGNGYEWVAGDQFGACLMDEFAPSNDGNWWNDFTLVDYIQTNYPFTRQESKNWTSEAVMQEGNYFFYFPYNYNMGGKRTPIRLTVPTEQYVKDGEATSTVLNNQLFLAYSPIVAEEGKEQEVLDLTMQPVLAFPAFNLKNVGTGSLTVKRIAFTAESGTVLGKTESNATMWPAEYELKAQGFNNTGFALLDDKGQRSALTGQLSPVGDKKVSKVVVTFGEEGIELSSQEAAWAYIMLPPATNLVNPKLYIYTDAGLGIAELDAKHTDAGTGNITNITNDRALTSFEYNDDAQVYITFDNTAMDQPFDLTTSSTSDLEDLVEWSQNNTAATLNATITGDKVQITKKIYDILAKNNNMVLNIKCANAGDATITIPAGIPADVFDRINFENVNVVNKTDLTLAKDVKKNNVAPAKITNEATITLAGNSYDLTSTMVDNNGTVTFQAADGKVMTVSMGNTNGGKYLNNTDKGTVTVATDVNVTAGGIVNNGTLTINEDVTLDGRIENGANGSKNGIINVNGAWTTKFQAGANYGVINVAATGSITIPSGSKFTNNANVVTNPQTQAVEFESVINNSGAINGITNNGTIVMKNANARLATESSSTGEIDNTEGSNYVTKQVSETVFCVVTEAIKASALDDLIKDANAKRLDISGSITIDPAEDETDVTVEVVEVNVEGNLKIDGAEKTLRFVNGTTGTTVNINAGTTEITARSTVSLGANGKCDGTLNLTDDATLIIANNARLYGNKGTVNGTVENYGNWYYLTGGTWAEY